MIIPDSEKKVLADFKIVIPELSEWKEFNRLRVGFFAENGLITKLNLCGLKLTDLPNSIGDLKELTHLNLRSNLLKNLPKSFQNIINLRELHLNLNNFTSLPDCLENLKYLHYLSLGVNKLQSLPDWFGDLKNLEHLDLSGNNFTSLPNCVENLKYLHYLSLGGNKLHSLPDWFGDLENLEHVSLIFNKISILPESFRNLVKLGEIALNNTGLRSFSNIPDEFIDTLDIPDDSWPWTIFYGKGKGNYPSIKAQEIIGFDFIDFMQYYRVSPLELAQKYAQDQDSLSAQEKDRLAWEGGFRERNVIEMGGIKPDDAILTEINKSLTITSDNGLELMK